MNFGLRQNLFLYAIAFGIAGIVPFILLPILTRVLSPTEFGQITAFLIVCSVLSNVGGITAHSFVSVRYFKSGEGFFPTAVSAAIATITISHIFLGAIFFLANSIFGNVFDLSDASLLLAICTSYFLSANLIFLAMFQSTKNAMLYLNLRAMQGFIELAGCLLLIVLFSIGSDARIFSYSLAILLSASLGFCFSKSRMWVAPNIDFTTIREILKFGIPLVPHVIAGTTITYIDRALISSNLGIAELGIYMVSVQLGMALLAIIDPLNKLLTPWLFEQISVGNEVTKRLIVKRTYQLIFCLVLFGIIYSIAVMFFADLIVGKEFRASIDLVPVIVAGFVMQGIYYTQVNYIVYSEKTGLLSMATVCIAFFGSINSYYCIKYFGLEGAALAFFLNNTGLVILIWSLSAKLVDMPWLGRRANGV